MSIDSFGLRISNKSVCRDQIHLVVSGSGLTPCTTVVLTINKNGYEHDSWQGPLQYDANAGYFAFLHWVYQAIQPPLLGDFTVTIGGSSLTLPNMDVSIDPLFAPKEK